MPQEKYSLLDLDEDVDEDRTASTHYAPYENMLSAAQSVVSCLTGSADVLHGDTNHLGHEVSRGIPARPYAIQGGFSMQLRGGRQSTRDIDLITTIKMRGVWDAITGVERIIIPDSRLVEGVIKIFVKTGAPWDACTENHSIEVDVKQAGFRSSPRNLDNNVETVGPFEFFGQTLYFDILNVIAMMKIKMECCLTREEPRDFEDVKFMIARHASEVKQALVAAVLDEEEMHEVLQHEKLGDKLLRGQLAGMLSIELEE